MKYLRKKISGKRVSDFWQLFVLRLVGPFRENEQVVIVSSVVQEIVILSALKQWTHIYRWRGRGGRSGEEMGR